MSKRYSSAKLTALVTAGSIALFAPQHANAVEGHSMMIRPGAMVGSSDATSDFFLDLFVPVVGSERGLSILTRISALVTPRATSRISVSVSGHSLQGTV